MLRSSVRPGRAAGLKLRESEEPPNQFDDHVDSDVARSGREPADPALGCAADLLSVGGQSLTELRDLFREDAMLVQRLLE